MSAIAVTPEATRQKNLIRIARIATVLGLIAASAYVYFGIRSQNGYNYLIAGSLIVVSIIAFLIVLEEKAKHPQVGPWHLMISGSLAALIISAVQTNAGAEVGTAIFITNLVLAIQTISPNRFIRAVIFGALVSVACSALAFYSPIPQFSSPTEDLVITWTARAGTLAFLVLIIIQFRNLNLANKFLVSFLSMIILITRIFSVVMTIVTTTSLTNQIGQQLHEVAKGRAVLIGDFINGQVELLQTLALDETVRQSVRAANALHPDLDSILVLDEHWRKASASGVNDPLIQSRMSNSLSKDLQAFQANSPEHVEVFVTDKQGAIVATTGITTDYYQADESWWQFADNHGEAYISSPVFDESVGALSILVAVPINDTRSGERIGILRTTLSVDGLLNTFNVPIGETGKADIFFPDGTILDTRRVEFNPVSTDNLIVIEDSADQVFVRDFFEKEESILASSQIQSQSKESVVNELGWIVVVSQSTSEALAPVNRQIRVTGLFGTIMAGIASMVSLFVAKLLADPILNLTYTANQVASGNLDARAQVDNQDEIGQLSNAFNDMTSKLKESLRELEARVAERTAELKASSQQLQKRAKQFEAMAQMARTITSIQDLETLLPRITQLTGQLFGFYHVGLFLLDESRQFAVLSAANSEGGQRMLARKHQLGVGQTGIVGYVTATGEPRIALDTGADTVYFDNPDLPDTRSEMALPLRVGKTIIGALDVQSTEPNAFSEEDVEVLSILADEVSIAIENARLFEESQRVLTNAQTAVGEYTIEAWQRMVKRRKVIGYKLSGMTIQSIDDSVQSNGLNTKIPIVLRDRVVGSMHISMPDDKELDQDEVEITQALAHRIGIAIENATLLEESQRTAVKEQMIGEITGKIGSSINLRNVLQTAVEELGHNIPGAEIVIELMGKQDAEKDLIPGEIK